mgnify:CR=1 FL=1
MTYTHGVYKTAQKTGFYSHKTYCDTKRGAHNILMQGVELVAFVLMLASIVVIVEIAQVVTSW